jgi:hypothetical protein
LSASASGWRARTAESRGFTAGNPRTSPPVDLVVQRVPLLVEVGTSAMPWWGGVTADVLAAALQPLVARVHIEHLTDPLLWGREIHDERYVLLAHI